MARMIPDIPKEFDPKSKEGLMFYELNNLPDDYYVFHSFSTINNIIHYFLLLISIFLLNTILYIYLFYTLFKNF